MPSFARELEQTLHNALGESSRRKHEYATLEHLLLALTGDERHLISQANMHLPGRQIDPKQVRRDLWRLTQWEQARMRRLAREQRGTTPAS